MFKTVRLSLLTLGMVFVSTVAMADDVALAAKLVGTWEGKWDYEGAGGKLTAKIASSSGNSFKGETKWFGTAIGDFVDTFTSAKLKEGKLKVVESTMDFEATVSPDGKSMEGKWTSPAGTGGMSLKKLD